MARKVFRCGVIGYGGAFSMGNAHLTSLSKNAGMEAAAICELDPKRQKVAAAEWPDAAIYGQVGDMLRHAQLDLATVITPHNTHAPLALQCLDAKVGVVLEKPMALTGK
ncbi:MAG TPA: Gfo/Idh/MocA family oxidoreductase, partial [Candidatus Latescibacteria bacterium]|nr:Gfo/Idh/MocA family oxidoreductase [Candidatus Latescibacterota bacterium]